MLARIVFSAWLSLAATGAVDAREPILGGPCDGCEAAFVGLPERLQSATRIAPLDEPGEAMVIDGTVFDGEGKPAPGVIVYAYHTDQAGVYPRALAGDGSPLRHGRLRGWARSDEQGNYRFLTIRPAAYPGRDVPQHVHMHVIESGRGSYYIDDLVFEDDPLLVGAARANMTRGRGGSGVAVPRKDEQGVWLVRRDIVLGKAISDY